MTSSQFTLFAAGSTVLDAGVATCLLLWRRRPDTRERPTINAARLVGAFGATTAFFLTKVLILTPLGVRAFGWIHLIYLDLVALLPALGLALLVLERVPTRERRWLDLSPMVRTAAVASLALAAVGIYATWIEPFRLRLEEATVAVSPMRAGSTPIRIGVLTDLQTDRVTDYERQAVERLMAQKPDVILLPGDVFQGTPAEFQENAQPLADLFARLRAPGGVYLVLGDVDGPGDHLRRVLRSSEVRLLVNEIVRVKVRGRSLTIGGVALEYASSAARQVVEDLEEEPGQDDIRIVVAHRPDVVLGLEPRSRIDLVVAGHTHGGQIVVPGYGPPLTLTHVPRNVAAGGLHTLDGNQIYVSRGVGHEHRQAPRIRFLCPPEISLLRVGEGTRR